MLNVLDGIDHEFIESQGFIGRKEALRRIKRWNTPVVGPPYYSHDLEMHGTELLYLIEELTPVILSALPSFDLERARVLALVHDDPETESERGDVVFSVKLNMSDDEKRILEAEEEKAIGTLGKKWPSKVAGFDYVGLLHEAKNKQTVESQLLSYLDKYSALCESLHELFAGNSAFHKGWQTERNRPPVAGTNMADLISKYTLIAPFFQTGHAVVAPYQKPDVAHFLEVGRPYTKDSILFPTGFKHYDFWKFTILKRGREEALRWLTEQREFAT
ncbi:MAG: HD domain-containing protein [Nanoarchaeota archaeon]|nr:HD domain-containing protein [Nanoarchaeota archaeon]